MSTASTPLSGAQVSQPQKRKASVAGIDGATQPRAVKRRASKACQSCRARKVRCNVTEHGAPCTNCRLDEVECTVSESRRKKKWSKGDGDAVPGLKSDTSAGKNMTRKIASRNMTPLSSIAYSGTAVSSGSRNSHELEHVPHSIYQTTGQRLSLSLQALNRRPSFANAPTATPFGFLPNEPLSDLPFFSQPSTLPTTANLPYFIKPLPTRIGPDEIAFLEKKGALSVPSIGLRNELLRAYIEFVHPYMPLLELYDFVMIVESGSGVLGRISLILFQAVMFAGSAFVDMHHLHNAGYLSRKEARKDFFQKTRLLYDFDYESDRVALVQALLLLTYYYETPDDQKDTWHWMGVATSVAHTIGLHRNPERSSNMDSKTTKLWKRIWWSTYMRDRLIALGMRRPTRIKTEDFDVPMLTLDDFELVAIPETVSCVPADCHLARDVDKQRDLAIMCIEKAKLCLCISHVLSTQYCVLNNNQGMVNDRTTMMLLPKKGSSEICEVQACNDELQHWLDELPEAARYRDTLTGHRSVDLHRSLLHMVFFSTLSALHRPQVLPSGPATTMPSTPASLDLLETSRKAVRRAADAITSLAQNLDSADLVRFLPTAGVTVLLPAIIIHLLDIKAPDEATRRQSLRGFCQCMQVMGKLRDLYAAADYSTAFLEAAIRKAGIHVAPFPSNVHNSKPQTVTTVEALVDAGRKLDMSPPTSLTPSPILTRALTPPPDISNAINGGIDVFSSITGQQQILPSIPATVLPVTDEEVARRISTFLASTPPESDTHSSHHEDSGSSADTVPTSIDTMTLEDNDNDPLKTGVGGGLWGDLATGEDFKLFSSTALPDFEKDDFDALLNFDAVGSGDLAWGFEDGAGVGWICE